MYMHRYAYCEIHQSNYETATWILTKMDQIFTFEEDKEESWLMYDYLAKWMISPGLYGSKHWSHAVSQIIQNPALDSQYDDIELHGLGMHSSHFSRLGAIAYYVTFPFERHLRLLQ